MIIVWLMLFCVSVSDAMAQQRGFQERHLIIDEFQNIEPIPLSPYLYITKDQKKELGTRDFLRLLRSRLPGEPVTEPLMNFSFQPYPHWLSFKVTNQSKNQEWVLDFGTLWQGRSGLAAGLFVMDGDNGTMILDALARTDGFLPDGERLSTQLPLTIPKGHTARVVIYVLPTDTAPLTLPLRLVPAQIAAIENRSLLSRFDPLVLSLSLGALFFIFCLWFKIGRVFLPFALFYAFNLCVVLTLGSAPVMGGVYRDYAVPLSVVCNILLILWMTLSYLQRPSGDDRSGTRNEQAPLLIYIVAAFNIFGLLIFFFILPQGTVFRAFILQIPFFAALLTALFISLSAERHHQRGARDLAVAWFLILVGHALGLVVAIGWLPLLNPMLIQAPLLSIAFATIWLVSAALARFAAAQDITVKRVIRKAQQAQSTARIKQSKENADQARLLRIIEREREIMEELRQRDAERTEEMRRAVEAADDANKAKSAFLAVVSHEIRTPMTGIMGMLRLLRQSPLTNDQSDYVQTIQDSGDAMMALLNDILDFSKIQGGGMALEEVDFDLIRLINGVSMLMSGHAKQKGIGLITDIGNTAPQYVKGDPTRLRQVLLNLSGNAIKFTASGAVTIKIERVESPASLDGEKGIPVRFSVIDTGIGISKDAQENLFSPFAQADSSIARKYGGTGLGLAICKTLIEAMGSVIELDSIEGRGTTFAFTLILPEGEAEQAIEGRAVTVEQPEAEADPDKKTTQKQADQEKSILVVDDNAINRKVIASMLEPMGHKLTMLDNAEEVLTLLGDQTFDLILMDIELPGLRGDEATKMIRSTYPHLSAMPIVGLTGHTGAEEEAAFKAAGMNDVLHKPIDPDALEAAVLQKPSNTSETVLTITDEDDSFEEAKQAGNPFRAKDTQGDGLTIFDDSALALLKSSMSRDDLDEMLTELFQKADQLTDAMKQSFDKGELNDVRARAHEIKGMCGNFGLVAYSAIADEIEHEAAKADAADKDQISHAITRLAEAQLHAQSSINQWLGED